MSNLFEVLDSIRYSAVSVGPFTLWVRKGDTYISTPGVLESLDDEQAVITALTERFHRDENTQVLVTDSNRLVVEAWKCYAGQWHPASVTDEKLVEAPSEEIRMMAPDRWVLETNGEPVASSSTKRGVLLERVRQARKRPVREGVVHYSDELTPYADNQVNVYVIDQNTGEKTFETGGTYRQFLRDNDDLEGDGIPQELLGLEPGKKIEFGGGAAPLFLIYMKPTPPSTNTKLAQNIFGTDGAKERGAYAEQVGDAGSIVGGPEVVEDDAVRQIAHYRVKSFHWRVEDGEVIVTKDTAGGHQNINMFSYKDFETAAEAAWKMAVLQAAAKRATESKKSKPVQERVWHGLKYRIRLSKKNEGRYVSDSRVEAVDFEAIIQCDDELQARELFDTLKSKLDSNPELAGWGASYGWLRGKDRVSVTGTLATEGVAAYFASSEGGELEGVYGDIGDAVSAMLTKVLGANWEYEGIEEEDDLGESKTSTELDAGLKQWVRDYQTARKAGNVKLAQELRGKIDAEIKAKGLNRRDVYFFNGDPDDPKNAVQERVDLSDGPDYVRYTYTVSSDNQKEIGLVAQAMRGVGAIKVTGEPKQKGSEFVLPVEVHIQPGSADPETEAEKLLHAAVAKAGVQEHRRERRRAPKFRGLFHGGSFTESVNGYRALRRPRRRIREQEATLKAGDTVTFDGFRRRYVVVSVNDDGTVNMVALEGGMRDSVFQKQNPDSLVKSGNPSRKFVGNFARNLRNRFDALVSQASQAGQETPMFKAYAVESRRRRRGGKRCVR